MFSIFESALIHRRTHTTSIQHAIIYDMREGTAYSGGSFSNKLYCNLTESALKSRTAHIAKTLYVI